MDLALNSFPPAQGMYDPALERDACGIGFVARTDGQKSNGILKMALQILINLDHRGARGADPHTGDGAGIMMQVPHNFLKEKCADEGFELPPAGRYAVGMFFLPWDDGARLRCMHLLEEVVRRKGQRFLGWRPVPTDENVPGRTARAAQPSVWQAFIAPGKPEMDEMTFERKLYVIRKAVTKEARKALKGTGTFYACSLSSRTLVYKGMLTPQQLADYYPDLKDERIETALALVHSRFSTNTFPSWERAHPYRYIIHNGEINTLRGNVNWMHARQNLCRTELFGAELEEILPVIEPEGSDSAMFDNCLEFLHLCGRELPHAAMMMVPEPWTNHSEMGDKKKAFYEYHSCLMEPWDGPAAIVFTDGRVVGALLDRNGLRPARYWVTDDGLVILASEAGVLDVPPEKIVLKDRLQPGRMLLVDTREGRIVGDEELKERYASAKPYRRWLAANLLALEDLKAEVQEKPIPLEEIYHKQAIFGYTQEDLTKILEPMARDGVEPVGSMGNDSPLAVLSDRPQPLYNYFKQLFAQVTNPPIDAIREELVTSIEMIIGSEGNLVDPGPECCRRIRLKRPVLTDEELAKIKYIRHPHFQTVTLPALFGEPFNGGALEAALEELFARADEAIAGGANILVLSDRGASPSMAPVPALLALSGLHHHLIRRGTRTKVSIVVESGEPREVHHFACLIGYGASAVNPYLAIASVEDLCRRGFLNGIQPKKAVENYVKACVKGIVKVMSKMGISTVQSYCGAQVFEAVGISRQVVDRYFTWTPSRVEGIDLEVIAKEARQKHLAALEGDCRAGDLLRPGSAYQWRYGEDDHLFNPATIALLQEACRKGDYALFKQYSALVNSQRNTLRSLLRFKWSPSPLPIEEVEPALSICTRFKTGAMSFGSISAEAHEALAIAMNRIGGKSNTGEGGEDPARYVPDPNGDSRRSAIKQVASGRFGVTSEYLVNSDEIQIKMAQGAKPGEGGQLPGRKVYPWIAKVRGTTAGVGLISPPPHHDIYSIEDLAQLIYDLKNANPQARINVKLVSEVGVGTIAAGVAKGKADVILISGCEGGTGASPRSSISHAGLPWELGLAETHQTLLLNGLRDRVVLETDGKLMTGRDVVIAALLGAEEYGFATAPLVVLGCVMMRVCHLDTCPCGIATQNPELRKNFRGDPQHVENFMLFLAEEVREIMAKLGFRTVNEMIGRTDVLEVDPALKAHWKAAGLDLSAILWQPRVPEEVGRHCRIKQDHGLERCLDYRVLLDLCRPALEKREKVYARLPVKNTDRATATMLGSELTRRWGGKGLPDDTITLHFSGAAGQSFGAFLPRGITLILEGEANDYLGKGLSGGKIILYPPPGAKFLPEENIIAGNVAFYGATGGEAYIRGRAGERFCVRNSGLNAVVEGVGDHGCEYMTGGHVVVIGPTGRNFAAGMTGGIAFVLDEDGTFERRCNKEMVLLERLSRKEAALVKEMIANHVRYTASERGKLILEKWEDYWPRFVRVIPVDYKRVLAALERARAAGLSGNEAIAAAFAENVQDERRVSGN